MSCCHHKDAPALRDGIRPTDGCAACAYKHFHTARRLANEPFYTAENRGDIVGELTLAQWHLWKTGRADIAAMIRDIRHAVQERKEAGIDWHPAILAIDEVSLKELHRR